MRRLVAAMVMIAAASPAAAQSGDAAAGRALAQQWCASCHVIERGGTAVSDSVPGFPAIAERATTTADSMRVFLAEPHGRMPNLTLSRNDIDNAIAYIISLRPN